MNKKRMRSFELKTEEQLKTMLAPVAHEIVQALRVIGPCSVRELGPKMGKRPNSLHYHIRRLSKNGMIVKVGEKQSGARTEAVYDVTADKFYGDSFIGSEKLRNTAVKGIATFLRCAERDFAAAVDKKAERGEEVSDPRDIVATRFSANLNESQLIELNKHIDAISELFADNAASEDGKRFTFTAVVAPVVGAIENDDK